ncbi:hypothetical protein BLNAU_357 [Blattamonas nauphoetae]|uniref:Uncharacterized protein n=1 Tax=Blattamonas nauphoetae TaxID=2049346 RepID=A0ABQ9YL04_9EUKA|nr:hypothetical protein BLNAU_357 [Blattamonas nauphoetae]
MSQPQPIRVDLQRSPHQSLPLSTYHYLHQKLPWEAPIPTFSRLHFGNPVPDLTGASPAATPQTVLHISSSTITANPPS